MVELSRRGLILGGAASIAGAAALPLFGPPLAANAAAEYLECTFSGLPGGDTLTFTNYGVDRVMATWTRDGQILEQNRLDWKGDGTDLRWWNRDPHQGRVLPSYPIDPQTGIFSEARGDEQYRINVNGFGIIVMRGAGQIVRFQVVGNNGRHHYGEAPRNGSPAAVSRLLDTFIDQTHTLNNQFTAYQTAVRQYVGIGMASLATGIALLVVNGANPVAAIAFVATVTAVGINGIANIRNAQNAYMGTYNNMITTFNRITEALGFGAVDIPYFNIGAVTWNNAAQQRRPSPSYVLFPASGSNG
ncbi:hypothetical protein QE418_002373 [Microbacterium testaceum]|uniref:hypothetical protein n=1 Tax=Microbacterium TaxID=33882 RepID=UPI001AE77949|nr:MULTISPECIES: hypothetical protein [Microbacterium]MDQ1112925.1 hypothetical protein [Microbacterium testaceum]MDQ1177056.1 hypothetical protein [Microbacterium sp. SORGH_AS_0421]MDR6096536.1 hypothetical protein [Microbacterium sp. SORGH_AS_0454]